MILQLFKYNLNIFFSYFIFFSSLVTSFGQNEKLKSGPMLGPVTLRTAKIWVQSTEKIPVHVQYRVKDSKEGFLKSETVVSDAYAHTATIDINGLETGTTYEYELYLDNQKLKIEYPLEFTTQSHWAYRTDPPAFKFAAGSCFYVNDSDYDRPGEPYGGAYEIIRHMYAQNPDFMLWLGDNTYFREGDFDSRHGIYHRQSHTRALSELQSFLASQPHYAIWDDHDYGPNDSDWTYPLKHHALDAFIDFWPSESYGAGHTEGTTSSFVWNDCQFFLLDNRWYRSVETEGGSILGDQQMYWLLESLKASKAPFKFVAVGGQFVSDLQAFENHANYAEERQMIIDYINDNKIRGVVFLSGDRHHSEVSRLETEDGIVIYDITSSALTSKTYDHSKENNTLRVPGSIIGDRNFAMIEVSGKRKERTAKVAFYGTDGKEIWNYNLKF